MGMSLIVERAVYELKLLAENVPEGKHVVTADIRKLSAKLYKNIKDKTIDNVFSLCEELLEEHSWGLGVIAFDWAYKVKAQYTEDTYEIFYCWLKKYVRGWGDCDDFCTHAFGELLRRYKTLFPKVKDWTKDEDFWVRRASAVILIPAILHNDYEEIDPLVISDLLLSDKHDLVQKGYGWMLKSLSQVDVDTVTHYLIDNHDRIPRTAFRYALKKYDKETRNKLMSL